MNETIYELDLVLHSISNLIKKKSKKSTQIEIALFHRNILKKIGTHRAQRLERLSAI